MRGSEGGVKATVKWPGGSVPGRRGPRASSALFAVLAVDPGEASGWCYRPTFATRETTRTAFGLAHLPKGEQREVVAQAIRMATADGLPLVMVAEKWNGFGLNPSARGGLVAAFKAWAWAWSERGQPAKRIVRVHPTKWRAAVLGRGNMRTAQAKALALATVHAHGFASIEDHNVAEAMCIAQWATASPEAGAAAAYTPRKSKRPSAAGDER
jgi:hypothetical protein